MTVDVSYQPDEQVDPESLIYTFGSHEPVISIRPGQTVATWTRDCFNGQVSHADHLASERCDPRLLNPQTGPFFIEGAEPGDTLAVHFVSIVPRHGWGVSSTVPYFGSLTSTPKTATLQPPLRELTWIYELDVPAGIVHYQARESAFHAELPLDPMHGTVGVAPALGEYRSTLAPGAWGGNMDTPEMRAGATCYLGVNVPGALLCLGDGHARQGEGETCGVAVETAMDTVFRIELIKGQYTEWPRIETDSYVMSTGSSRPLEDAFRISQLDLVRWVCELTGLSELDAYQYVTQLALTPVANVVDVDYTVVSKLDKRYLPGVSAYDGVHSRLTAR